MPQSVSQLPVFFAQDQKPWLRVDKESHVVLSVKQTNKKSLLKYMSIFIHIKGTLNGHIKQPMLRRLNTVFYYNYVSWIIRS